MLYGAGPQWSKISQLEMKDLKLTSVRPRIHTRKGVGKGGEALLDMLTVGGRHMPYDDRIRDLINMGINTVPLPTRAGTTTGSAEHAVGPVSFGRHPSASQHQDADGQHRQRCGLRNLGHGDEHLGQGVVISRVSQIVC